jgi:very-short-patch-repair endonuclease
VLDRQLLRDYLLKLARCDVEASSAPNPRPERVRELLRLCDSELEKRWLLFLDEHDLRLPNSAQKRVEGCNTRPDFLYEEHATAVYIDGPHHDYPDRVERDAVQAACMADLGYTVIRFSHQDDWPALIRRYPSVFGRLM